MRYLIVSFKGREGVDAVIADGVDAAYAASTYGLDGHDVLVVEESAVRVFRRETRTATRELSATEVTEMRKSPA